MADRAFWFRAPQALRIMRILKAPMIKKIPDFKNVSPLKTKFRIAYLVLCLKCVSIQTRRSRPRWFNTLQRLAIPICKNKTKQKRFDTWHMTGDRWQVTLDRWHKSQVVNIVSKLQVPSSNGLGFMVFWRLRGKWWLTQWINQWIMEVSVEQPPLLRVC